MTRIAATTHGESRIRMLRIVRRGDRHDPRDLTVSCRFEGQFAQTFVDGSGEGLLPGEAVKNLVHATARDAGAGEIETFALTLADRVLRAHPRVSRVRVEVAEQPWARLEAGGKARGQSFVAASPERRTTAVTSNGEQVAVVSGIEQLAIMRSSGFAPSRPGREDATGRDDRLQRLLVATVAARWTYSSPDVTFGPYRQGVRAAVVETIGCHGVQSVQRSLYAAADVVLASFQEISEITLSVQERPYRPADLFSAGIENPDDLFVAIDEPLGFVEVTVERG
jgi:urate oxidase